MYMHHPGQLFSREIRLSKGRKGAGCRFQEKQSRCLPQFIIPQFFIHSFIILT